MSVSLLQHEMRKQALNALGGLAQPRYGIITEFQLSPFSVKVKLQPEDSETGWLQLLTPWAGNGWGLVASPKIGSQALIVFQEGNIEAGVAVAEGFSDALPIPDINADTAGGEFFLIHSSGAAIKLTNDGAMTILGSSGQQVAMDASGNINSTGTWTHTGTFEASGEITALSAGHTVGLGQLRDVYNTHDHPVAGGAPKTGQPFQQE